MAPKEAKRASAKGLKKNVRVSLAAKSERPEVKFLHEITIESNQQDIRKFAATIVAGVKKKDEDVLRAACEATERLCVSDVDKEVLFTLLKEGGVECVAYIAAEAPTKEIMRDADLALSSLYRRTVEYLDSIEGVDFDQVPNVMYIGSQLAAIDEEVAAAMLAAMERLVNHRNDNCYTMISSGALGVFHLLLASHRAPELCDETLQVLFRVCDCPGEVWAQPLLDEEGLIKSVVETLNGAPLNMRLQVTGLRLLALWNQPEAKIFDKGGMEYADMEDAMALRDKIRVLMKEAGVPGILRRVLVDLRNSGLHPQAAWIKCLAVGYLVEGELKPRASELLAYGFSA